MAHFICWEYRSFINALADHVAFNLEVYNLRCPYCQSWHFDQSPWSHKAHQTHLCEYCGATFEAPYKGVSNPLISEKIVSLADLMLINPPSEKDIEVKKSYQIDKNPEMDDFIKLLVTLEHGDRIQNDNGEIYVFLKNHLNPLICFQSLMYPSGGCKPSDLIKRSKKWVKIHE